MKNNDKIPDDSYLEISEEITTVLKLTERKMRYQEQDLKVERIEVDQKCCVVTIIPSKEDSYERLLEERVQFTKAENSVEEQVLKNLQIQQLHEVLSFLPDNEKDLIERLFFKEQTEREVAKDYGVSQNAINKRRKKVLNKLKMLLENLWKNFF